MKKGTIAIISGLMSGMIGIVVAGTITAKVNEKKNQKEDKFKTYYSVLAQWLALKQEEKSLEQYFINNDYKTIAIYGMGEVGVRLYMELKDTSISVKYGIDKNSENISATLDLNVVSIDEELEKVDVIVVTAMFAYEEIEKSLLKKDKFVVIPIENIIYES